MTAAGDAERIVIAPYWADLNEHLCDLVRLVPSGRLDEAPEGEWGVRAVAHHIVGARQHWLARSLHRGTSPMPDRDARVGELVDALRASWLQMASFLSDSEALAAEYEPPPNDPEYRDPSAFTGHYVASHRFAHDVHHRAQLLDRIRDLQIDVPASIHRRPL